MNIILLYISLFTSLLPSDNPQLTINISNIKVLKGELIIGIFDKEATFLKDGAAFKNYKIAVDEATESIIIEDLPKGDYAISLYHDENSDGKCNRNMLGIPKEGYGFSNNIKPKFSAPSYKDCKFSFVNNKVLDIVLRK